MFENNRAITLGVASGTAVKQLRFVTIPSGSASVRESGVGEDSVGISLEGTTTGGVALPVSLLDGTIMEVAASGAISVGDKVSTAAFGRARTAVTDDFVFGTALTASSATDDVISIVAHRPGGIVA
jgi:hypothetical protein